MNREQAKQLLPIIAAFAEGKEIQFRHSPKGMWHPSPSPGWSSDVEYRVKPRPVVVERWAAACHKDGSIRIFTTEGSARDFVNAGLSDYWSVFMMRGTYER